MIPKIIHYCWFGNTPIPLTAHKCLESWKKYLPEYEIILWNEENSPMKIPFVRDAYKAKKYAFVADYVRIWAVYTYGGIYMDTDMLVIRPMGELLEKLELFFGYEDPKGKYINAAIFGAVKNARFISDILFKYDNMQFSLDKIYQITIPNIVTEIYETKNLYRAEVVVFNYEYFYPLPQKKRRDCNFMKYATSHTYAIHLWDASWLTLKERIFYHLKRFYFGKYRNK